MNDPSKDLFDDLKQFIQVTVGQSEERLSQRIDGLDGRMDGLSGRMDLLDGRMDRLENGLHELRDEVHEGFAGIADAMEATNSDVDARLTRLEKQPS